MAEIMIGEDFKPLGQLLIANRSIRASDLDRALENKNGDFLGVTLVKSNVCTEEDVLRALAAQFDIERIEAVDINPSPDAIAAVTARIAYHHHVIPVRISDDSITLVSANPQDIEAADELRVLLNRKIDWAICDAKGIEIALKKYYGFGAEMADQIADDAARSFDLTIESGQIEDIGDLTGNTSVIKFVNSILLEAYQQRATDIHLEPTSDDFRVRFRVDGVLTKIKVPDVVTKFKDAIISRIKVMAALDIAENRVPQDGRVGVRIGGEELDLRVSVLPAIHGETVDIRMLNSAIHLLDLSKLGLHEEQLETLERAIRKPHGIVLLTGPTGSGKTTTLYACLKRIRSDTIKIITIEDPVEYRLEGITQIQVNPGIDFDFARGLRSMLRHDPDVMMVGEIRDGETARIATRVARSDWHHKTVGAAETIVIQCL